MLEVPARIPSPDRLPCPVTPGREVRTPQESQALEDWYTQERTCYRGWLAQVHAQSWQLLDEHPQPVAAATGLLKAILELHSPEPHWGGREVTEVYDLSNIPTCTGCENGGGCGCSVDQPWWPCTTYWAALEHLAADLRRI